MFNTAVTWFGITIENALQERVKVTVGTEVSFKPKYTLTRLLNSQFKLPKPPPEIETDTNPWASLYVLANKRNSGVKKWKYVD